ncbi:DUF3857 domain-containing transglutaminase family protein [Flavihumibacter profundi]|uniref:DUF3857 domain-containing transglutaminase family protein n=1 Tax=Flavihumibacter profundi TaxID=2716883 RepID=UPI001CC4DC6B|nr:DUF3857 domain-containing protein [Flavihumibacter profundi]MBZ5856487.1 DUF3857 domain-containing protein [Flavihumibacter profundi]
MRQLKSVLVIFILFILPGYLKAGEYPVSAIPKSMLTHANAVIRKEEQVVEIRSLNKVTVRDHYVITILNEAGEQFAYWQDYYSKMRSIDHIDGNLYDALGNKIRSLKKSEIQDEPMASQVSMVMDRRIKYHNFNHKEFPYTVEYDAEVTNDETMFLPDWSPLPGRSISVEKSSFTLVADPDYEIRTRAYNLPKPPVVTINGKAKTMVWEINAQTAIAKEFAAPPLHELAPYISFGASDFKLDDFKGSMRTWQDFGRFISKLNEGLGELPEPIIERVNQIVAGAKTDEEKVNRLYAFLQQNTHYISISLGIGGWRPFPASYVASKGYGDCKALSNYMVALLKVAGIKAYYVLINGGAYQRDIPVDFPASNFNHAICAVPLVNDTIWLECTSQTTPPGYMGSFTGNRHALLITEEGGKLVSTPTYDKRQNIQNCELSGTVDGAGTLNLKAKNFYQAQCSDQLQMRIHAQSREEQLIYLKKNLDIPHYDVVNFDYQETVGRVPSITENLIISAPNYAQVTGKRLFIMPNILNRWDTRLVADTARLYPVELSEEKVEKDSVVLTIPEGYITESLPKPLDIQTPFGQYKSSCSVQGDKLYFSRSLALNKGKFAAADYNNLLNFYEQVFKADRAKAVLVKIE